MTSEKIAVRAFKELFVCNFKIIFHKKLLSVFIVKYINGLLRNYCKKISWNGFVITNKGVNVYKKSLVGMLVPMK